MKKGERKILRKALSYISSINNDNIPSSVKLDINSAKQCLIALNYEFKSSYSYLFFMLMSSRPVIYEIDFRIFCEKMRIEADDINSKKYINLIDELKEAFDLEVSKSFPLIIFKIYNKKTNSKSWNVLNFEILAKAQVLSNIKYNTEFIISYRELCDELQCNNYKNFAHFRQNVLYKLDMDFDMVYDVASKEGKKIESLKFIIYKIKATQPDKI